MAERFPVVPVPGEASPPAVPEKPVARLPDSAGSKGGITVSPEKEAPAFSASRVHVKTSLSYKERLWAEKRSSDATGAVGEAVEGFLEIWDYKDLLLYAKIVEHWRFIVKEPLAEKVVPQYIQNGVLYLSAEDPAYANAMLYHKQTLLGYIRVTLQSDAVRDVVCKPKKTAGRFQPALQKTD